MPLHSRLERLLHTQPQSRAIRTRDPSESYGPLGAEGSGAAGDGHATGVESALEVQEAGAHRRPHRLHGRRGSRRHGENHRCRGGRTPRPPALTAPDADVGRQLMRLLERGAQHVATVDRVQACRERGPGWIGTRHKRTPRRVSVSDNSCSYVLDHFGEMCLGGLIRWERQATVPPSYGRCPHAFDWGVFRPQTTSALSGADEGWRGEPSLGK